MPSKTASEFRSILDFRAGFPSASRFGKASVLVYDSLLEKAVPGFSGWSKSFSVRLPVQAGESLKSLSSYSSILEALLPRIAEYSPKSLVIVAAGGGSVGDFAGFLASTLKRGVRLVHLPSTWLAAIDSAHGGKNALNVGRAKNQIGTFYPASEVGLIRALLRGQPRERAQDALGELAKIALIDGRPWVRDLKSGNSAEEILWKTLKDAIDSKYRVVLRDPHEEKGIRHVLNLGHTLGHVLEVERGLSHGDAIGLGLRFALGWSLERGVLSARRFAELDLWLNELKVGVRRPRPITASKVKKLLLQDKKRVGSDRVRFVFVRDWGKTPIEAVSVEELIREAIRQGWVKK